MVDDYSEERDPSEDSRSSRALSLIMGSLLLLVAAILVGVKFFGSRVGTGETPVADVRISSSVVHAQATLSPADIALTAKPQTAQTTSGQVIVAGATAVPVVVEPVIPVVSVTTVPKPPISLEQPASLLSGMLHGLISPVTFVLSLITPTIRMYDPTNGGVLYDFGFLLGLLILIIFIRWWFARPPRSEQRHA